MDGYTLEGTKKTVRSQLHLPVAPLTRAVQGMTTKNKNKVMEKVRKNAVVASAPKSKK